MNELNFTSEQIKLLELNKIIPPNCPTAQVQFFAEVCKRKRLDPFLKQIHLIERNESDGKGGWKKAYTIQAGLDGMRAIAQRNCKIIAYKRWIKKESNETYGCCEISTEDRGLYSDEVPLSEYIQKKKDGTVQHFWKQFPQTMIKKCAEESVLRMLAPEDLSGVYGDEEMMQAESETFKQLNPIQEAPKTEIANAEVIPEPEKKVAPAPPLSSSTKTEVKVDAGVKKRLIEIANESSEEDRKVLLQFQSKTNLNKKELGLIEAIKEKNAKSLKEKTETLEEMKVKLLAKCIKNIEGWTVKEGIGELLGIGSVFPNKEEINEAITKMDVKDYDTIKTLLLLSVDKK